MAVVDFPWLTTFTRIIYELLAFSFVKDLFMKKRLNAWRKLTIEKKYEFRENENVWKYII